MIKNFMICRSLICIFLLLKFHELESRNPRRALDKSIPSITVSSTNPEHETTWASLQSNYNGAQNEYKLTHRFLRLKPIKHGFDQDFFQRNYLPMKSIVMRNQKGSISGTTLSELAEQLLDEIKTGQRKFLNFTILKDKDFNYKTLSGLLILKYKKYPFVLKLSIEHPHTIVQPFSKSIEALGIFVIGGNLRHLSNFTRIPNLQKIKEMLSFNPFYLNILDYPRKWFWKPKTINDLKIVWQCNGQQETIFLPSMYATISDFIQAQPFQPQSELNKLSMKIAMDTGFLIDPHAGNIIIEQNTHRYVLLDTEDFRILVGLNQSMKATKYIGWYIELINNSLKNIFFCTKQERLEQNTMV